MSRFCLVTCAVLLLISTPDAQQPTFMATVDLVSVAVSVADRKGQLVSTLAADDFVLLEDGRPQRISHFARATEQAPDLHLGLLLDVSESMGDEIGFARTASIRFVRALNEAQDLTFVDFDTEVRAARFAPAELPQLVERIRSSQPHGETALFDAIGVYLAAAAEQAGRSVMLLYTDGGDTRSAMSLSELMDVVKTSSVTIYPIGMFGRTGQLARAEQEQVLRKIAETSGGRAFFPLSVKDLDGVYAQVLADIRAQYVLGYTSTNQRTDGSWRKVDIRLGRPDLKDLKLRARKGYYALKRAQ
jgi:Ca-activated chloride channel family protein